MKEQPLVSVVLPVYNGADFVAETIKSILNQTYQNMEIIIIDDCSADNSREVIESFQDDRIITYFFEKNQGVCRACNFAFSKLTGEYCAVIGHDDLWYPDKIEKQVLFLEENEDFDVCLSWCDIIDDDGVIINDIEQNMYQIFRKGNKSSKKWLQFLLINGNCLCSPSAVFRKNVFSELHYSISVLQLQDYEMWLRVLLKHEIYIMDDALLMYRKFQKKKINLSSADEKKDIRLQHETYWIHKKFLLGISDEDFVKSFSELFLNKDSSSREELLCERIDLLHELSNPYYMEAIADALEIPGCDRVLEEKFHVSISDFYESNAKEMELDNGKRVLIEYLYQKVEEQQIIEKYQATLDSVMGMLKGK